MPRRPQQRFDEEDARETTEREREIARAQARADLIEERAAQVRQAWERPRPNQPRTPDNPLNETVQQKWRAITVRGKRFICQTELEDDPEAMRRIAHELVDEMDFQMTCLPKILSIRVPVELTTNHDFERDGIWTRIYARFGVFCEDGEDNAPEIIEI